MPLDAPLCTWWEELRAESLEFQESMANAYFCSCDLCELEDVTEANTVDTASKTLPVETDGKSDHSFAVTGSCLLYTSDAADE